MSESGWSEAKPVNFGERFDPDKARTFQRKNNEVQLNSQSALTEGRGIVRITPDAKPAPQRVAAPARAAPQQPPPEPRVAAAPARAAPRQSPPEPRVAAAPARAAPRQAPPEPRVAAAPARAAPRQAPPEPRVEATATRAAPRPARAAPRPAPTAVSAVPQQATTLDDLPVGIPFRMDKYDPALARQNSAGQQQSNEIHVPGMSLAARLQKIKAQPPIAQATLNFTSLKRRALDDKESNVRPTLQRISGPLPQTKHDLTTDEEELKIDLTGDKEKTNTNPRKLEVDGSFAELKSWLTEPQIAPFSQAKVSQPQKEKLSAQLYGKLLKVQQKIEKTGFRNALYYFISVDYQRKHIADEIQVPHCSTIYYFGNPGFMHELRWEHLTYCKSGMFLLHDSIDHFMLMVYSCVTKNPKILYDKRFQDVRALPLPSERDFSDFESQVPRKLTPPLIKLEDNRGTFIYLSSRISQAFLGDNRSFIDTELSQPLGMPTYLYLTACITTETPRIEMEMSDKERGNHFVLFEFHSPTGTVTCYDSFGGGSYRTSCEHCSLFFGHKINQHTKVPIKWRPVQFANIPMQTNNNCALHVMANLAYRILGTPNTTQHCERLRRILPLFFLSIDMEKSTQLFDLQ